MPWFESAHDSSSITNTWVDSAHDSIDFPGIDSESTHDSSGFPRYWFRLTHDSKCFPIFRFKSTHDSSEKHSILSRLMIRLWVIPMSGVRNIIATTKCKSICLTKETYICTNPVKSFSARELLQSLANRSQQMLPVSCNAHPYAMPKGKQLNNK